MRISDWSSDVCSSDLFVGAAFAQGQFGLCTHACKRCFKLMSGIGHKASLCLVGGGQALQQTVHGCNKRHDFCRRQIGADGRLVVGAPCTYSLLQQTEHFREAAPLPFDLSTRSEEHTSEIQSLMRISYAVFCLKKKT